MSVLELFFGWTGLLRSPFEKATKGMVPAPVRGATGKVLVEGTVRGPAVPLVAPFSGEPCVLWAATHAEEATLTRTDRNGNAETVVVWREHFRSVGATAFEMVDASGGVAHVAVESGHYEAPARDVLVPDPDLLRKPGVLRATWSLRSRRGASLVEVGARGTTFVAPLEPVTDSARVNAMPPELDAFFRARGVLPTQYMSIVREHRLSEARIGVGARVLVLGEAHTALSPRGDGYRGGDPLTVVCPAFVVAA